MSAGKILVVDDDDSLRRVVQFQLQKEGFTVSVAANGRKALEEIEANPPDLVLTDLKMPGLSGLDLLKAVKSRYPEMTVILMTAFGTIENAVEAMKAGAFDYIIKPVHGEELLLVLQRAFAHQHLLEEVGYLRRSLDRKYGFENIIGRSGALLHALDLASRAAQATSTVLIYGETGTGKELVAKAIHFNSPRKEKPFITINCSAIPKDLLESELFGHVKGSFTGAVGHKKGKVESADGGTLFLDEIGEMPPDLQVKLLRLIQEGEIEKIGAAEALKVQVRILAATHRNLKAMTEDGTFREDLYYRLAVIPLQLPPLRNRLEDIPELVEHFFRHFQQKVGRPHLRLSPALMPYFCNYRWPGNVRELENAMEHMVVLARGEEITVEDLPEALRRNRPGMKEEFILLSPQGISLEAIEKDLLLWALRKAEGNQTRAAALLDISRKTFLYRLEKYGISRETTLSE